MKISRLHALIFMALCCTLGLFTKKLINPFANIVTELLHIPGGISTGFSIMFLIIARELAEIRGGGLLMGTVQGLLALVLGRVGSMGALMPIGYIVPGLAIDLIYGLQKYMKWNRMERMVFANALAAFMASVTANVLIFHLRGPVLWLYLCVSATYGTIYGYLGAAIVKRLQPAIHVQRRGGKERA